MKKVKRALFLFLAFLTVGFCFKHPNATALENQSAEVEDTLTGDTLRLKGGQILRCIGLKAPPLRSKIPLLQAYGSEALGFTKKTAQGKKILVEWGSQIRDEQNNLLGYLFLEDGTFLNESIIKEGHAQLDIEPPNTKYAAVFRRAELEARRSKKGIWKEAPDNPFIHSEYIGEKNTKIFYWPTSPELERIPQNHLVRFRSRIEALAAGYKPSPSCREEKEIF